MLGIGGKEKVLIKFKCEYMIDINRMSSQTYVNCKVREGFPEDMN